MQAPVLPPPSALPNPLSSSHASTSFQPQPDSTSSASIGSNPPPQPQPSVPVSGQPPFPTFASMNHPQYPHSNNAGPGPSSYPNQQQWYPPDYYGLQSRHAPNAPYPNTSYNRYHDQRYQQQQPSYAPIYQQNTYGGHFPHVPVGVGAGGPGPATLQNGYGGYQGDGFHPSHYGGYQPHLPVQPDGLQHYPVQPNGSNEIDGQASQQHIPPTQPHLPYTPLDQQSNSNIANGQPSFPPNIQQQQTFHPAYPPNHPYAYGVGVGIPHYSQQSMPYGGYGGYAEGYAPPVPVQGVPMPRTGPSSGPSKGLNPAAQGFTFQPAQARSHPQFLPNRNGDVSAPSSTRTEQISVFSSIPIAEQTSSILDNHVEAQETWVSSAIVNGETPKSETEEQRLPEKSQPGSLGLSEVNGTCATSESSSPPSLPASSISATASTSTPAMSTSPTTATTPISVQTPRATTDGENSFINSPKSGLSQVQPDAGWTFGGEGLAGLTSPPASATRVVSGPSTRSASGSSVKRRSSTQPIQTGPLRLSAARPDAESLSGNVYALSLGGLIPKGVNTEEIHGGADATRAAPKGKNRASGKRVVFVAGVDGVRTPRHPVKPATNPLVFGSAVGIVVPATSTRSTSAELPATHPIDARPVTPDSKPVSRSEATTPQPKVKPFSWAAAVRGSQAPSPAISTSQSDVASPAKSTISLAAESEAGPSRLPLDSTGDEPATPKSTSTSLPPPSTGASAAQAPRPAFNYAAAAAAGASLSPQEELARLLADGLKGKGKASSSITLPRGLINTGNMCFANTILQVLVYCQPFTDLFEELGKRLKADLARRTPLLEAMIVFLREFNASTPIAGVPVSNGLPNGSTTPKGKGRDSRAEAFIPENVYDAMKENKRFDSMRRGHQEDAEEYLGFFLNTLHEELLYVLSRTQTTKPGHKPNGPAVNGNDERQVERPVSPGAADDSGWLEVGKKQKTHVVRNTETRESAVSRLFGGTLRSLLRTPGQKDSVTLEPYQPLQLDIQASNVLDITDALKHISEPEIVPGVWSSARNANVDATKQVYIDTFPTVLILHLKRFVYDAGERSVVKRSKPVAYGTELVVPPEIISPSKKGAGSSAIKFRLFGVVYHHGISASGGHYTVSVSRQDASGWIHFDDETVASVPTSEVVVSRTEAESGKAGLVGGREKCAYLLFYQRVR